MQVMWPRSIYLGKSQSFVSHTHVERAKGVLGDTWRCASRSEGYWVYDTLVPEPLNFKSESASDMIKSHPRVE